MYYEENNIIPKEEYKHIIDTLHKEKKFRPARISVVRKVFFNREINYLTDAVSVNQENTDIKVRYDEIIEGLGLDLTLDKEFETIHEQFRLKAGRNYAASRGEYLNGIVLANYLGFEFIDAATVIRFDDAGNFEADRTDLILSSRLNMPLCLVSMGLRMMVW